MLAAACILVADNDVCTFAVDNDIICTLEECNDRQLTVQTLPVMRFNRDNQRQQRLTLNYNRKIVKSIISIERVLKKRGEERE